MSETTIPGVQPGPDGKVPGVDVQGRYIGRVDPADPRLFRAVPVGPATADPYRWDFDRATWVRVWPVDVNGVLCLDGQEAALATCQPPQTGFVWSVDEQRWVDRRTPAERTAEFRARCLQTIDAYLTFKSKDMDPAVLRGLVVAQMQALADFWRQHDAELAKMIEYGRDMLEAVHDPSVTVQDQLAAWHQFHGYVGNIWNGLVSNI